MLQKDFKSKIEVIFEKAIMLILLFLDIKNLYKVEKEKILYKCGWSPFEGHTFSSQIFATIINGQIGFRDGKIQTIFHLVNKSNLIEININIFNIQALYFSTK